MASIHTVQPVNGAEAPSPAFASAFLEYYDALLTYLFRLTTNRADAEDLAQSTFLKAARGYDQFKAEASFKTWIFAIATNLARDHFRVRRRWYEDSQDQCRERTQVNAQKVETMRARVAEGEAQAYAFKEHIDFCFTCLTKTLPIEQQVAVMLKEIYQFKVSEIMEILGCSEGKVKHALANGRGTMNDIFDRRCALINKDGICHQCSEIAGFVNPKQDAPVATNQLDLAQAALKGRDQDHLFALRTALIQHLDPLDVPMAPLHEYLLGLIKETADLLEDESVATSE